ncbi:MAG: hypothetical protein Q9M40_11395 [Sulfurimonas sp.]|nr:hypothetical protein [Sulfurimonas sp.]
MTLIGCSTQTLQTPSENKALNSISKSNAKKKNSYYMQNATDSFLKNEWKEKVLEDKEIKEKYPEKENHPFTLQEYVDKVEVYSGKADANKSRSNVSKLQSMPVIGE